MCITAGGYSLAGQLLQGKSQAFVFVGASLLANRAGKRASPQANIRWQACLLQGEMLLVFVGASLLANRAGKRESPQANIRWQACLLQGESAEPQAFAQWSVHMARKARSKSRV